MSKKTVLHITAMKSTKFGGVEHYFLKLLDHSNDENIVTVMQYEETPKSLQYLDELKKRDVEIKDNRINKVNLLSVFKTLLMIAEVNPDIIHCHFINSHLKIFIPIFSKLLGIKRTFYTVHSCMDWSELRKIIIFMNMFDKIFPVSKNIKNNLIKCGLDPKKVEVNYLGLVRIPTKSNELREHYRDIYDIKNGSIVFGCIAFDDPVKGMDILLKAFKGIDKKYQDVELMIIGIEPDNSESADLAEDLGLFDDIIWVGITDKAIDILNAVDVYVQPSRSEGLSLAVLEAMALGLPIIATEVGGIPEAVKHGKTGFLIEPNNIDELYEAMETMLNSFDDYKILGKNGYLRYKKIFRNDNIKDFVKKNYL